MANFIEIIDKDDSVKLINIENIVYVKVNPMAICSIIMVDGSEIETEMNKEILLKELKINKK